MVVTFGQAGLSAPTSCGAAKNRAVEQASALIVLSLIGLLSTPPIQPSCESNSCQARWFMAPPYCAIADTTYAADGWSPPVSLSFTSRAGVGQEVFERDWHHRAFDCLLGHARFCRAEKLSGGAFRDGGVCRDACDGECVDWRGELVIRGLNFRAEAVGNAKSVPRQSAVQDRWIREEVGGTLVQTKIRCRTGQREHVLATSGGLQQRLDQGGGAEGR